MKSARNRPLDGIKKCFNNEKEETNSIIFIRLGYIHLNKNYERGAIGYEDYCTLSGNIGKASAV